MSAFSFTVHAKPVHDRMKRMVGKAPAGLADGLFQFTTAVIEDAKENYVPVDQGTLRDTGVAEPPVISSFGVSSRMSFSGPQAVAIHEHLSEHSPPSWQIAESRGNGVHFHHGGPKYLERPLIEHSQGLPQKAGDALIAAVKGVE